MNIANNDRSRHLTTDEMKSLANGGVKRNFNRTAIDSQSMSPSKQRGNMDYLDKQKVDVNRVRIERIKNVLETQYEKQNTSLERNLRNQVQNSVVHMHSQMRGLRNNSGVGGAGSNLALMAQNSSDGG